MSVEIAGSDSCASTNNVQLTAHVYALGGSLWFGVDTYDARSAPFDELVPKGDVTLTGFVYDCDRDEIPYSFAFQDEVGSSFAKTIVLHRCESGISPRESC